MVLFVIASLIPAALIALAVWLGGAWAWLALIGGIPCAMALDAIGWTAPAERDARRAVRWMTSGLGLLHLALMPVVVIGLVNVVQDSWSHAIALWLAAGNYFGHVANSNAHELIHMPERRARRLGAAVYSAMLFGHHTSAHRLVHHVHVASDADPNSARAGEGFYSFWPRAWIGSFMAGLRAVNAQRARRQDPRPIWTHPYVGYALGGLAALGVAGAVAGWAGVLAWLLVCLYAQEQLLMADYVQHYGLRRAELADGTREKVSAQHSWNAPHVYTAAMMLNAPRHSDHHMNPQRSFVQLRLDRDGMPVLPASLPVMGLLGLIPPVWRSLMDPLLADWQNAPATGHVPAQTAKAPVQAHGTKRADLPKSVYASQFPDSPHRPDRSDPVGAGDGNR